MSDRIIRGMPAHEYHAVDALSSTRVRAIDGGRAAYRQACEPAEPSHAMRLGTAVHALLTDDWDAEIAEEPTTPDLYIPPDAVHDSELKAACEQYGAKNARSYAETRERLRAVAPDLVFATELRDAFDERVTRERAEWEQSVGARTIVSAQMADQARAIAAAARRNPYVHAVIQQSEAEVSAFWTGNAHGHEIACKARVDLLHPSGCIVDIKTTAKAEALTDDGFQRLVWQRGWHRQLAWYEAGLLACGQSLDAGDVFIAVVTTCEPYTAELFQLGDDWMQMGREQNARAVERLASWLDHPDGWDGPSADLDGRPRIRTIPPASWMLRRVFPNEQR